MVGPEHLDNVAHLACRTVLAYIGVSHIACAVDLQLSDKVKELI